MTLTQAVVLGLVQGLTEFLPVSSSGHLLLVPHVFGWADQGLAFDAMIHLGTLGALVACFRAELLALGRGGLSPRLGALIVAASVPAGLAGLAFGPDIERSLRSPVVVAASTAVWAIVMWIADRQARPAPATTRRDPLDGITWGQALAIGVAQAVALVPGTSRSGITISTGLLGGLDRATAARFSFLLGIPITAAAAGLKSLDIVAQGIQPGELAPMLAALATAFASGWFAAWFLVRYLKRRSLRPFVLYRLLLAAAVLLVAL
ncbi:MAG TPA: undecaprenyl-diphosphate phosphatase [Candidatus Tectomicrobia bacterium]|nr:undecaprenyl-diphosphate phosphatase [Candidatus Tectomicrobia bacterium]